MNQLLEKLSDDDYDVGWVDPATVVSEGGGGGAGTYIGSHTVSGTAIGTAADVWVDGQPAGLYALTVAGHIVGGAGGDIVGIKLLSGLGIGFGGADVVDPAGFGYPTVTAVFGTALISTVQGVVLLNTGATSGTWEATAFLTLLQLF